MTVKNSGNTRIRDNQCYQGGMTGLKIQTNGDTTIVRRANLLPEDVTLGNVVGAAGYRTCLVNKWHLDGYDPGASPNHRGFDETSWYDEHGEWSISTKRYAALVTHMDYNIGRLLGTLDALGQRENTIVISGCVFNVGNLWIGSGCGGRRLSVLLRPFRATRI